MPKVKPLRIDLTELFGGKVPDSKGLRQTIGQAFIDKIVERTQKGKDKDGKRFKGYSKTYKESLDFKAHNKKAGKVDLKLTGDMQRSIDVVDENSKSIYIGFDNQEDMDKAHGHITGGGKLPVRDFWGLTSKEKESVRKDFQSDVDRFEKGKKGGGVLEAARLELLKRILRGGNG